MRQPKQWQSGLLHGSVHVRKHATSCAPLLCRAARVVPNASLFCQHAPFLFAPWRGLQSRSRLRREEHARPPKAAHSTHAQTESWALVACCGGSIHGTQAGRSSQLRKAAEAIQKNRNFAIKHHTHPKKNRACGARLCGRLRRETTPAPALSTNTHTTHPHGSPQASTKPRALGLARGRWICAQRASLWNAKQPQTDGRLSF